MHNITTAIVLAGGLGTRLRSVVSDVPKPMAPINGKPFLEYLLSYWISQGVKDFIISVGYLKESIIQHFGYSFKNANIRYVIENEPLGTGGGLLFAGESVTETFLVLNGDTYIEIELDKLIGEHYANNSSWTIALFETRDFDRYLGLELTDKNEITGLESSARNSVNYANGGVYLLNADVIDFFKSRIGTNASLEGGLLPEYLKNGKKVCGHIAKGKFIDIGLPEDYRMADKIVMKIE